MRKFICFILVLNIATFVHSQISSKYTISFDNAVHHEAIVNATFSNLKSDTAELTMSRSSPGRYALHEFVKNVYNLHVTDGSGNVLNAVIKDPYKWTISGHDGTIKLSYTLFANHGDGTYAQIDETHAHLNLPATFMYVPELAKENFQVTFSVREDLNWKVATQLRHIEGNTYFARDLQYFMDSPTEISNHSIRSFDVDEQSISFVLHHEGTEAEFDQYFEKVKSIVLQQKAVFGELPRFDYANYYFLACYMPQVSGDAMEHRNSTYLTTTRSLDQGGIDRNVSSVSHEFFHCWNVERFRPDDLEPFDFSKANMSGLLWFAEGFTNYYTSLTMYRAGLMSLKNFINGQINPFNYVWNSPGRRFFNPIEMSYQAPFVDDATSIDKNNRNNTFISYYTYGDMLGLALDLALREKQLNLDDYMKMVWFTYGKNETPYTVKDLHKVLVDYAGKNFGDDFFNNYIYKSDMPDMKRLFENVGVSLTQNVDKAWFGRAPLKGKIDRNTMIDSPAYRAGIENSDLIISIGGYMLSGTLSFDAIMANFKPNDKAIVVYERFGVQKETEITFAQDPTYSISLFEDSGLELSDSQKEAREDWLSTKE